MAEPERLVSLARRDVREWHRAQRPRDAWLKAVYRMVPQVSDVLRVVRMQRVAPLQELSAVLQAQADESELLQGQSLRVRQASQPAAALQGQEAAPWVPLGPRAPAPPGRLAFAPAQPETPAPSV